MQRVVLGVSCIAMLALASACEIYDYPDTGVTANTGTLERDETIEEGKCELLIHNLSTVTIWTVNLSPSDDDEWGLDQLQSSVIAPGEQFGFRLPPWNWDLRLTDADGTVILERINIPIDPQHSYTLTFRAPE